MSGAFVGPDGQIYENVTYISVFGYFGCKFQSRAIPYIRGLLYDIQAAIDNYVAFEVGFELLKNLQPLVIEFHSFASIRIGVPLRFLRCLFSEFINSDLLCT